MSRQAGLKTSRGGGITFDSAGNARRSNLKNIQEQETGDRKTLYEENFENYCKIKKQVI